MTNSNITFPKLPKAAINLIKEFEGCRLEPYVDPRGIPTIGWGATWYQGGDPVTMDDPPLTQEEADALLLYHLSIFEEFIHQHVKVPLTPGQYGALVSLIFNVGPGSPSKSGIIRLKNGNPSTLLRKLNEGDYEGAGKEFLRWISPGSNVERGLRRRRMREYNSLWLNSNVQ